MGSLVEVGVVGDVGEVGEVDMVVGGVVVVLVDVVLVEANVVSRTLCLSLRMSK